DPLGSSLSKGLLLLRFMEEEVGDELKLSVMGSIYSVLTLKGQENLRIKVRIDGGDVERLHDARICPWKNDVDVVNPVVVIPGDSDHVDGGLRDGASGSVSV
nr:hypothetical protein [Tanacetum cinerariifolium]